MEASHQPGFLCGECSRTFSSLFSLAEHGNLHNGNRPFACAVCLRTFQLLNEYAEHYKEYHASEASTNEGIMLPESLEASSVDLTVLRELPLSTFLSKDEEVSQPKNQISDPLEDLTCQLCSKKFRTKKYLTRHKCAYATNRAKSSVLCSCLVTFSTSEEFRNHVGTTTPFTCCDCKMEFPQINYLKKHIRSHTKERPFVCSQCNRAFSQKINLKNHMSVHAGDKAIKCQQCSFACRTPGGLFKHMRKHKLGLPVEDRRKVSSQEYECDKCGKKFKFERNLGMHMKSHQKDNCLCPECGKVLHGTRKLADHIRNCHGESYKCPICNKELRGLQALRFHEKTHRNEKNFTCPQCNKAFTLQQYLRCHMRTHTIRPLLSCDTCNKQFVAPQGLKYHKKMCGVRNGLQVPLPTEQEYTVEGLL